MKRLTEKRQHKRVNRIFKAMFSPNSDVISDWECESKDISEGGVRIKTIREPILGKDVEMIFNIPNREDRIIFPAEVIWTLPSRESKGAFEAGIKFIDLTNTKIKLLKEYIS
jgi:hypothetical protein